MKTTEASIDNFQLAPREEIKDFEPYLPGRSVDEIKKAYGLKRVVKLAANENPLGPSPLAVRAVKAAAGQTQWYPDGFCASLRSALAKRLKVKVEQVCVGAGSDELIELLGKAYLTPEDEVVVSEHTFARYALAAQLMGARVKTVPMRNFTHDLEAMAGAVTERTKFVFVANPNNPTGTYNTAAELEEFLITLPARVMAVIDEAYFEYGRAAKDYPDAVEFFKTGRNLMALRTFSKIYGLAGLRVGYGVAPEPVVETLDRLRLPYNVSSTAQAAAEASLKDEGQVRRSLRLVGPEKKKMEKALDELGLARVPSAANFIMFDAGFSEAQAFCVALLKKGVLVRAMGDYGFPRHVRVTVGLPEENRSFLKALRDILKEERNGAHS